MDVRPWLHPTKLGTTSVKTYCLAAIPSSSIVVTALSEILPRQTGSEMLPGVTGSWLLRDFEGDAVAYFSLVERDDTTNLRTILADISGRHYNEDDAVLAVLKKLQARLGGEITNDDGEAISNA